MELFERELTSASTIEGIEFCHYRNPNIGIRVDGFWMNDDAGLDLFVSDFENRTKLETLTGTDVGLFFRRISNSIRSAQRSQFTRTLMKRRRFMVLHAQYTRIMRAMGASICTYSRNAA